MKPTPHSPLDATINVPTAPRTSERSRRQLANHVGRGLATLPPRPRVTQPLLDELRGKLTPRDWWVLAALAEHRVLTTNQLARLAFDTDSAARHRLHALHQLRAIDRFRPQTPVGSAPWHYVLDKAGAILLSERREITLAEVPFRPDDAVKLAFSRQLAHTIAVNEFFTSLAASARGAPGTELEVWWPERRCARTWGTIVRPDGYGVWRHYIARVGFFTEIDLGTEPLDTLVRKVAAYARLAHTTSITTPVLFHLLGARREYGLHQALNSSFQTAHQQGSRPRVLVATTTQDHPPGPAGPVWLPAGGGGTRLHLTDLPTTHGYTIMSPAGGETR